MKTKIQKLFIALALLALSSAIVRAQGTTAFTFQGRLNTFSGPAFGSYDMTFAVYDANVAGDLIAGPITNTAVVITNGLFTVTLDFGQGVFTGTNYWVQMAVSPAGANTFSTLVPRQQLTAAPYALSLVAPQSQALCPPGSVMAYMGTTAPSGWLMCDGTAYPTNQYPALFAVLGGSCGASGNTFNVPDCRGIFLRGVTGTRTGALSDPDDNPTIRTNIFAGGNAGNAVGSYQQDAFQGHSHDFHFMAYPASGGGNWANPTIFEYNSSGLGVSPSDLPNQMVTQPTTSSWGNVRVSTETRPSNIYVNYIIKY